MSTPASDPALDSDLDFVEPLADALRAADYRYDDVTELLGARAHEALSRNETTPGLLRTEDRTPLATLVRLFLLQAPVAREAAEEALPGLLPRLIEVGVLTDASAPENPEIAANTASPDSTGSTGNTGDSIVALLDIRPYAASGSGGQDTDLWVLSDLTPGLDGAGARVGGDHVLGISAASSSLAQLTMRDPVGSVLDLGTGCGVQALHAAEHADRVVATDVNLRALWVARVNARLNGFAEKIDVREGSFWEPVAGERFDLITTNPPFVVTPPTLAGQDPRLVYRDAGLPGDTAVSDLVAGAGEHLNPGGWCQILANWIIERDRPWDDRLAAWIGEDCDAFVVQREVVDPAAYVSLWLKDSGHHGAAAGRDAYVERYRRWLEWFDAEGIEAIGFGWINLRRRPNSPDSPDGPEGAPGEPIRRFLEWPYDVEQPIGPAIGDWADGVDRALALTGGESGEPGEPGAVGAEALLAAYLEARPDLVQETHGAPGAADPETVVLRQQTGLRRARTVDTAVAALVGACDGELSVGQIVVALAQLLETDADELRATMLPQVAELIEEGYLR